MKETLNVQLHDAAMFRVKTASNVVVKTDTSSFPLQITGGAASTDVDVTGSSIITIQVTNDEYAFFSATFTVTRDAGGIPSLVRKTDTSVLGYADILGFLFAAEPRYHNTANLFLGTLEDANPFVKQPPVDGAGFTMGRNIPTNPTTISANAQATGWDCLTHTTPSVAAPGRLYLARRAGTPPNLVGIWRPDYLPIDADAQSFDYLFFFPPRIPDDWGSYPWGTNSGGIQQYVDLIYRYFFTAYALAQQIYRVRRKCILVMVADVYNDAFKAWGPSRSHLHRLLLDVHMFIHLEEKMDYNVWHRQPIGRIGLSAYSSGLPDLISVMQNTVEDTDRVGLGATFTDKLKEIYDFDGHDVSNATVMTTLDAWRGTKTDRFYRIYHQDPAWSSFLGHFPGATPSVMKFFGVNVSEAHDGNSRSIIILPETFLTKVPVPGTTHSWMMEYFPAHALAMSQFDSAP